MEFRVFNGHIEMDGQPIAKLLDKINEWEVKDELKNYDGSNAGCDCDYEGVLGEGYRDGESTAKAKLFDVLSNMDDIETSVANKILEKMGVAERFD